MTEKIKLIWDFRGPAAKQTAFHHELHLKEFLQQSQSELQITGHEEVNEYHHIAYMVVEKSSMIKIRDLLKPHRGQLYLEAK